MPRFPRLLAVPLALAVPSVLAVVLAAPLLRAQLRTASPEELGVVKVLLAQESAWNKGDIDGFASGYKNSPDTIFIGSHVSKGFAELITDYKKNYPNRDVMGTLGFSGIEVHPLDERFAVALGHYHVERSKKAGGNADGIFSLVLEKTDSGWKIVVDHTT